MEPVLCVDKHQVSILSEIAIAIKKRFMSRHQQYYFILQDHMWK